MQKVIKINAFQKGRLVSIAKKIIMLYQLELKLKTLQNIDSVEISVKWEKWGDEVLEVKAEIKELKSSLKKVTALGGVGFEKWLADYGLNIDNFDINVKEGK